MRADAPKSRQDAEQESVFRIRTNVSYKKESTGHEAEQKKYAAESTSFCAANPVCRVPMHIKTSKAVDLTDTAIDNP